MASEVTSFSIEIPAWVFWGVLTATIMTAIGVVFFALIGAETQNLGLLIFSFVALPVCMSGAYGWYTDDWKLGLVCAGIVFALICFILWMMAGDD